MKNIQDFINENICINESKESIQIGGITFKEGNRVVYTKQYEDENGDDVEEELEGTLNELLPNKKANIEFGDKKFVVISTSQLVGVCKKSRDYTFKTNNNREKKLYDIMNDISYELNYAISKLNTVQADMEQEMLEIGREMLKKDNPDADISEFDFGSPENDKYMDAAANKWEDENDTNGMEIKIEKLKNKLAIARKKYNDYVNKDGSTRQSKDRIKYIKGYTPID